MGYSNGNVRLKLQREYSFNPKRRTVTQFCATAMRTAALHESTVICQTPTRVWSSLCWTRTYKLQHEICAVLGNYAAWSGNSLLKFRDILSVPSSAMKKIWPICCPETSVRNHLCELLNFQGEHISSTSRRKSEVTQITKRVELFGTISLSR